MTDFDGDMRADSAAALVYTTWTNELTRLIIGGRLGAAQFGALHGRRLFRPALVQILTSANLQARWCSAVECSMELNESLRRAVDKLVRSQGTDIRSWRWGRAHAILMPDIATPWTRGHGQLGERVETGGDPWTISMTHYGLSEADTSFPTQVGPNARLVYDLADQNASWFVQMGGPEEDPSSALNGSFAREWQGGRYRELRFEPRRWLHGFTIQPRP
jgi:penicillin G amidase